MNTSYPVWKNRHFISPGWSVLIISMMMISWLIGKPQKHEVRNRAFYSPIRITLLVPQENGTDEENAAWRTLENWTGFKANRQVFSEQAVEISPSDLFWIHASDEETWNRWAKSAGNLTQLRRQVASGGSWLLTGLAAQLPHLLGLESVVPEVRQLELVDDWGFDKKGLQGFRGHPLFAGLHGGAFIFDSTRNLKIPLVGYFGDSFPGNGRVVAVEKSYITIHDKNRLVVEYDTEKGMILAVGGLIAFNEPNGLSLQRDAMLANAFRYLAGQSETGKRTYWISRENRPHSFEPRLVESPMNAGRLEAQPGSGLEIRKTSQTGHAFDLAGRRVLIMGSENGGIEELWVHPVRVMRDLQLGLITEKETRWLDTIPATIRIRPESITRRYETSAGELEEIIYPALHRPGAIIHLKMKAAQPQRLVMRFRCDLRWMWPYDAGALGDLQYGYDHPGRTLQVSDPSGDFFCIVGTDSVPVSQHSGHYRQLEWVNGSWRGQESPHNEIAHARIMDLSSENGYCLTIGIVGVNEGFELARDHYQVLMRNPGAALREISDHYRRLISTRLVLETPDTEFDTLWKWSLVGADRFWAHTPGLGTGLMAGYATTAHGWDGRQEINGRPGYAWYFGRDAVWSAFAVDDYGDWDAVRGQLDFFQKFQNIRGEIFHELSSSGVVHYDSADATPLYVILMAHYLKASGDLDFLKRSWPSIRRAMSFLESTDTDGDGLIENTNVGHGWVEGGALWGAHTTLYLAGLWSRSLADAAWMAGLAGDDIRAVGWLKSADRVRQRINEDFWNPESGFLNYGLMADGSYNPERTILPAIPMYFGLIEDPLTAVMLRQFAGSGFSSDWGVRILSSESALFNPEGYHYGSVWPLYTGWTALAEYRYGNSNQAFTHVINNMYIKNHWAAGYVEEVMNGAVYEPSGVCSHQCWSETNIIHPVTSGMLGWRPDALAGAAFLSPRFPPHWNRVTVRNLRQGENRIKMEMKKENRMTSYRFSLESGPSLIIRFSPELDPGMNLEEIQVNGEAVSFSSETHRGVLKKPVSFRLNDPVEVRLHHRGGMALVPLMPRPEPGDTSRGFRILNQRTEGEMYVAELQGPAGVTGVFRLHLFDSRIESITGATLLKMEGDNVAVLKVIFPAAKDKTHSEQVIRIRSASGGA